MQLEVKNLTHIYSQGMPYETTALKDVSFTCPSGDFLAFIGHTGSGKSTLLQHLNGLLKPTSGSVLADGTDINEKTDEAKAMRRKIGMVFQYPEYQLFEETILKDVCFGPKNQGLSEVECIERARKALTQCGIDPDEKGDSAPFALSGGEKRRVAIAGVLAMQPQVLILDEPTAGLDPKGRKDILTMIDNIQRENDITIIFVSHNMDDVVSKARHVIVIERGQIAMDASPHEVFSRGDELKAMGLSLPSATEFLNLLRNKGLSLDADALTIDEAEAAIIRHFAGPVK